MKSFKKFLIEQSQSSINPQYGLDYYSRQEVANMNDPVHMAALDIHDAWMERNPKADYNAHQHVHYQALPKDEQEKDIAHLKTVAELHGSIPVPSTHPITGERLTTQEDIEAAHSHAVADEFGRRAHEEWRAGFEAKSGKGTPRMKSAIDESGEEISVNINVPWDQLHPQWKDENYQAGLAAHEAFKKHIL